METSAEPRTSARVLLLDGEGRLLLFRGVDPGAPDRGSWWFTPGGGLDPGETHRDGAVRELFEETGLRSDPQALEGPVHEEQTLFEFATRSFLQHSTFFVLRVDTHDVDISGFQEVEASSIVEHRWWTRDDLRATDEVYYPACLNDLLDRVA
ncbi:MAG: hydrolase [Frankiales bacterium]|nr:hydrolase [Frankiales bacterium]